MADHLDAEITRAQGERGSAAAKPSKGPAFAGFGAAGEYDTEIYGGASASEYAAEVAEIDDDGGAPAGLDLGRGHGSHPSTRAAALPQRVIAEMRHDAADTGADAAADPMRDYRTMGGSGLVDTRITSREDSYHARRHGRALSPERGGDAFAGETPARGYAEIMQERMVANERAELLRKLERQRQDGVAVSAASVALAAAGAGADDAAATGAPAAAAPIGRKRRRWDDAPPAAGSDAGASAGAGGSDASSVRSGVTGGPTGGPGSISSSTVIADATSLYGDERVGAAAAGTAVRGGGGGGGVSVAAASTGARRSSRFSAPADEAAAADAEEDRRAAAWDAAETPAGAAAADPTPASLVSRRGEVAGASVRSRWDETPAPDEAASSAAAEPRRGGSSSAAASSSRWGETPDVEAAASRGAGGGGGAAAAASWGETPQTTSGGASSGAGAGAARKRSRWDETPAAGLPAGAATPSAQALAAAAAALGATPTPGGLAALGGGSATPLYGAYSGVAGGAGAAVAPSRAESEMDARNRPMGDDELDALFPPGYKVLEPPASYVPLRTPSRKLTATPTPGGAGGATGFRLLETPARDAYGVLLAPGELSAEAAAGSGVGGAESDVPHIRPEDMQYFGKLAGAAPADDELSAEEAREREIMLLLLKIKSGTPQQRKLAMRGLTAKARGFGAAPLFGQLLPLMMSPSLEDQERHVLVKVIDRVLFRLDDLVRPHAHKILQVIEPMLIDEDYYARAEGRQIVANLAKAAGLATMISVMRPDIDHADEDVRNTTSRAFAVVASALGVPAMLPFLKAVAASKKSWEARHTGVKIVQQVAILLGVGVLPHLKAMVDIVAPGLEDEQTKVRIMAAMALAALAEGAFPYGIEAFDRVLRPLWSGVKHHRNKALAAFLKAIGCLIPLMDAQYASYYTREVMPTVIREFGSADDEMRRIVLKVVQQCVASPGVEAEYVRAEVLPEYFRHFWVRRTALDKRNYRALVDTTASVAEKVGAAAIIKQIVEDLKDDAEPYRRMVVETVDRVLTALGASDIDARLEEQLVDGILYAFQEQAMVEGGGEAAGGGAAGGGSAKVMLAGFGTVVGALGLRCKPYLPQIAGTIKWRLNNKAPTVRVQAADLIGRVAGVMRACGEEALLGHLGVVLFECLGEEYPDVLGSILGGLKAIVSVIGTGAMQPPVKDLLPRLTPILKNRHEKVQENCIDLVGRIADRGAEHVPAKEWMRICFDLLEMLRAPKKAIRRACVNTFGYIAKAIGPQDVLHALLNNLKVTERTMRVCTTIAIAIVAETCQPYTVLPALMNEYRVPDLNVQNGVLKAVSFLFEYIGGQARDYVYAVTPLLEDALIERDMIHRQTALFALKHLTLGLQGLGCEDALQHLLNYAWPNIFETLPHLIQAFFEVCEAMRVSLGPQVLLRYTLQGLFHPARKVREPYWKVYNNLYVYAPDALTPAYPALPSEGYNRFEHTYMELLL